jgi:hypothetical protein
MQVFLCRGKRRDIQYFCLGQIHLHCHCVSLHDLQLRHWFGSFLVSCKMSRPEVCKFYRRRFTFQYAVLTLGQYRDAHVPGARLYKFGSWYVIFCWPSVLTFLRVIHLAPKVLRSLLDFGEICISLAEYVSWLFQPLLRFVTICRCINPKVQHASLALCGLVLTSDPRTQLGK